MATVDNFFVTITVFGLAIIFLVGLVFWGALSSVDAVFEYNDNTRAAKNNAQTFYDNVDTIFLLVFFGLHLGILILVFALRSHPIVYVAAIILIAVLALVAAPLSNTYETVIADSVFASDAANIPTTNYLITNLPMIEVVLGFITLIILGGLARAENLL